MFALSSTPLEQMDLKSDLASPHAGALATFEGWVRNHHEGRAVLHLEYEAYEELATTEGSRIVKEAQERFEILGAKCLHRIGKLKTGEMAVWVGVTAAHRAEAFEACQYIINEVKARVPIWKKEYYSDGDAQWVNYATIPVL